MFRTITKTLANKYPKWARYFSVILILLFTIPLIFIIGFGGQIGSYIGMVIYMIIGAYSMYEVFKNMELTKYSVIFLSLSILVIFFLPWTTAWGITTGTKEVASSSSNFLQGYGLTYLFRNLFSWKMLIFFFATILVPLVVDPKLRQSKNPLLNIAIIVATSFIITFFAKGMWIINNYDWTWVFYFVPIAIIADTFAFFGGMLFGKKWFKGAKLAPKLSPKKTWAGFVIGYIFSALFVGIVGWYMHIFAKSSSEIAFLIIAALFIPIISPLGDLLFSAIKRYLGIKDFSNLLPGHGGAVDRIDAMSTVIFTFVILFMIF